MFASLALVYIEDLQTVFKIISNKTQQTPYLKQIYFFRILKYLKT